MWVHQSTLYRTRRRSGRIVRVDRMMYNLILYQAELYVEVTVVQEWRIYQPVLYRAAGLVISLVLSAQSTTKDYIRTENKLQSISKLFIPQVIITQVSFSQTTTQIIPTISERKPRKTIAYMFWSPFIFGGLGSRHGNLHQFSVTRSRGTYFALLAHTGTVVSHSEHRKNSREVWGKCRRMDRKGRN